MHARGLIDAHEHATLQAAELPPARWYLMVIEWVMAGLSYGKRQGLLTGDGGFEAVTLGKVCELRSACMTLPDELAARIPLAYVHFTAFLVDALLFLSPLALVRLAAACPTPLRPLGKKEEEEIPPVCSQIPPVRSLPFRRTARPSTCAQPSAHVSFALAALSLSSTEQLPRLGAFTIVLGPLIVLFYRGLLELSKSFLDPFGNRRVSTTGAALSCFAQPIRQ